ncbi:MAG: efflux RND transporter periplasmic adaptor subunit [Candidatus Melainabacteria bacterium]|nr:efflux RND transporter periplasmic adaptor subunit [Candidatus Melainabacteria bacterium]
MHLPLSKLIAKFVLPTIGLIVLYVLVQSFVQAFRNPNRMDFLKSLTMEMTVQVPPGAMPVATETVVHATVGDVVTYTGTADAFNDIPIFPRVQGWIVRLPVYSGDFVHKGQLLAQLDSIELSARLNEAKSAQEAAQNAYLAARKAHEEALAHTRHFSSVIHEAKANLEYWEKEIKREAALLKQQIIYQEEYDRELAQYEASKSKYEQALSQCHAAEMASEAAEYRLKESKSLLTKASASALTQNIIRDYTRIYAPVNGVVTDRKLDLGILAKPETELMRVAQIDPIRIQSNVALSDIQDIKIGTPVKIWTDKQKLGKPIQAKVTSIFKQAELPTRTVIAEALIPNREGHILPGHFVTVDFQKRDKHNVLVVSNEAIIDKDQQRATWLVEDGKARLRYITTGITDGVKTEIVKGLNVGEAVITRGQTYLRDGDLVEVAAYTKDGLVELPRPPTSNRLAKTNNYTVKQTLRHYILTTQLFIKPPIQGINRLAIEVAPIHGIVPDNLTLDVTSHMLTMPKMTVPSPTVAKSANDRFQINFEPTMPGLWQLTITLKEGQKAVGTTEIFLELAD